MNNFLGLFLCVVWVLLVAFFMYITLKFVTNRFNIHPAWLFMTPVNLVWLVISMLLADGVFWIAGKISHFNFL
jgi:hypothetical protein